jgi:hypothetical protein
VDPTPVHPMIDPSHKPDRSVEAIVGGLGCLVFLAVGFGLLWAFVAIVKWMWTNSLIYLKNMGGSESMPELQDVLISVWRQSLVDGGKSVEIDGKNYPVKLTAKRHLKQVDSEFDGHELRGLEQNPDTKSRWAKMAREGKKVMQFLEAGRYVAVVVDGKMKTYG